MKHNLCLPLFKNHEKVIDCHSINLESDVNTAQIDLDSMPDSELIDRLLEIYDQKWLAGYLSRHSVKTTRETINRWAKRRTAPVLTHREYLLLDELLPKEKVTPESCKFRFIDLFAGIGGIRKGFEEEGGLCVFTSEWDKFAARTYKANHHTYGEYHTFNDDIREVTLSTVEHATEEDAYQNIEDTIPDHDILLAGFPCQPFSIAGVSKKNALGVSHGFECNTQGTLFFDVARIIKAKQPKAFVLENVKNLKSHDRGNTFRVIMETLEELGYWVSDAEDNSSSDPKVIDGQHWVPQHRQRIVLVGFRKDLDLHQDFTLKNIKKYWPENKPKLDSILDESVDDRYILTPRLWEYLYNYAIKHRKKGNGFGYGLVDKNDIARTLSARYYKDGSEILIDRGWDFTKGFSEDNLKNRPRRLTPTECARLMGFARRGDDSFRIPVSDTQAYKQFGNSVVVPVFHSIAKMMVPRIV